jgi:hypothetical protein
VAVGAHRDPEIAAFLNFDWYSPPYRSYHSEDELLGWYREAHYDEVRILPQRTSAIARRRTASQALEPLPEPVIRANLEAPPETPIQPGERFVVGGWALEEAGRSPIVRVHLGDRLVATTGCFAARLDVKAAFPRFEHALYTGFHVVIRMPLRARDGARLRVTFGIEDRDQPAFVVERDLKIERVSWRSRIAAPLVAALPERLVRRLSRVRILRGLAGRTKRTKRP